MESIRTVEMTNEHPDFYRLVGPFLSRRAIAGELGYPVWDDDDKRWWVALDGPTVLGFVALRPESGKTILTSAYVLPAHRKRGVYRQLFAARLAAAEALGRPIESTVMAAAAPAFEAAGFTRVRSRGRYVTYCKEIARDY